MDIVTTDLPACLDGLAAVVAACLLEPGLTPVLPDKLDRSAQALWAAQRHHFPPLLPAADARAGLQATGLHRLVVVAPGDRPQLGWLTPWTERARSVERRSASSANTGAVTSVLVHALRAAGITPSPAAASLFLCGIHVSTGHMRGAATCAGDHAAAAACLRWGAALDWLSRYLTEPAALVQCAETVGAIRSRRLFTLPEQAPLSEASDTLHRYRINSILLTGASGGIVGVLSRREVDEGLRHGMADEPAGALSSGPPPVVPPSASLPDAQSVLHDSPHRLMVVGTLSAPLGVVTRSSLFQASQVVSQEQPPAQLWARACELIGDFAPYVATLGEVAEQEGVRALLIGGCVRDVLLDRPSRDVDVVVVGDAPALARAAAATAGGEVETYDAFGTAHWKTPCGLELDLASARTESYPRPGALPVVERGDLRQDLFRRDFTINMMALGIAPSERGVLVDPYAGRADLLRRQLRVVHGLSFTDDPTRAWRAARFAARFDLSLAPGTASLLREALRMGVLDAVSDARLGNELHRIFQERRPDDAIRLLRDWGLLQRVHPSLVADGGLLDRITATRESWLQLRTLAPSELSDPAEPLWVALGWSLPSDVRAQTQQLVSNGRGRSKRWVSGISRLQRSAVALSSASLRSTQAVVLRPLDAIEQVFLAGQGHQGAVSWWLSTGQHIASSVRASDLLSRGVARGPGLGRGLRAASAAALDGASAAEQLERALEAASP